MAPIIKALLSKGINYFFFLLAFLLFVAFFLVDFFAFLLVAFFLVDFFAFLLFVAFFLVDFLAFLLVAFFLVDRLALRLVDRLAAFFLAAFRFFAMCSAPNTKGHPAKF